jgi:hypothetical protein
MPLPYTITYTVRDAKNELSTPQFYLDGAADIANIGPSAAAALTNISTMIDGAIIKANLVIPIDVSGIGLANALPGADVEEGGRFQFETTNGFTTSQRLPTFKESLIQAGSKQIDLADANVSTFVSGMTGSWDGSAFGGTAPVKTVDSRNEPIAGLVSAKEKFGQDRG